MTPAPYDHHPNVADQNHDGRFADDEIIVDEVPVDINKLTKQGYYNHPLLVKLVHVYAKAIVREFFKAAQAHHKQHSLHEGYAVLLEELEEAWAEVKQKHPDIASFDKEAVQTAAMALRWLIDRHDLSEPQALL